MYFYFLLWGKNIFSCFYFKSLIEVLGFTVTYNDFPKKGEYLTLVSLSTNPPQVAAADVSSGTISPTEFWYLKYVYIYRVTYASFRLLIVDC